VNQKTGEHNISWGGLFLYKIPEESELFYYYRILTILISDETDFRQRKMIRDKGVIPPRRPDTLICMCLMTDYQNGIVRPN
jgi:hypothetical protein